MFRRILIGRRETQPRLIERKADHLHDAIINGIGVSGKSLAEIWRKAVASRFAVPGQLGASLIDDLLIEILHDPDDSLL
jgi:hypothetical protein